MSLDTNFGSGESEVSGGHENHYYQDLGRGIGVGVDDKCTRKPKTSITNGTLSFIYDPPVGKQSSYDEKLRPFYLEGPHSSIVFKIMNLN